MLILYSWKKVYKYTNGRVDQIIDLISYITYKPVPVNKRDRFYTISKINWSGTSFIVNPEALLENIGDYKERELAEYIALCSYRSYAEYKAMKTTTLDLLASPVDKSHIEKNRLLSLENGKIHFQWEPSVH